MVGQLVGKYRVQDRIGRGGMGTVYRATDETLHREVAIKVLNPELNDPEVARRFRSEAITVARLSHPGIATIYELFEYDGQWLMVMEFVRGETLEHLVERTGGLPIERATEICIQALTALAHAHGLGVVHRDLKPANLMVTEQGAVKIMDFGIARVAGTEHLTTAGFMMGTPAYMAPEQVLGKEIDGRADLYAIGVVMYRIATGKLPFKGDTPFAMAQSQVHDHPTPIALSQAGLAPWVEQVIGRALSKAPEDRFQTADEFREALKRGLAGFPIESAPNAFIPPELLVTAAPRTMPTLGTGAQRAATGSVAMATAPTAVPQPAATAKPTATAGARATAAKPNITTIALAAALVVIGAVAVGIWYRSRPTATPPAEPAPAVARPADAASTQPPPPPSPEPTTVAPAPVPVVPQQATQPPLAGSTVPPATGVASNVTGAKPTGAPGAPTTPGGTTTAQPPLANAARPGGPAGVSPNTPVTPGISSAPSTTSPPPTTTTPARGAAPDADAHVAFSNVKFLTLNGKKAQDQDVVLNFVGGQISVVAKRGGAAITSLPYQRIGKATYVHAKRPMWDSRLPSPPEDMDLPGGFLRTPNRHWLVLQSQSSFLILRLEDENARQVLETVEARMGTKVDRPVASEK